MLFLSLIYRWQTQHRLADTIDQSLTDRAKRQVRLNCICFIDPGKVVTINNVEENRAERYAELVDWKWPTIRGKL